MPIYEYMCERCGYEFEREQRMTDPPVKTCPQCRSRRVTKLISQSSFVLKGGGWYADGYSDSKAGGKSDSSDKEASPSSDGKSEPKSETKGKDKDKGKGKAKGSKKSAA
jgi:putative FmdB family regulatory protein